MNQAPKTPECFTVYSSHGELVARFCDGLVVRTERYDPLDPESEFIDQIAEFDMGVHRIHFRGRPEAHVDILCTAYVMKNGHYEPIARTDCECV
jgi:hypothetical protein